jgi:hypothetical protein
MADTSFLESGFFASLCGAVVGALASIGAQQLAIRANERQARLSRLAIERKDREEELERQAALSLSILVKIGAALTVIADMHILLHDAFIKSVKTKTPFSSAVPGFSVDAKTIEFSNDEIVFLRRFKIGSLISTVIDLPSTLNMYIEHMKLVKKYRGDIENLGEIVSVGRGGNTTIEFKGESRFRVRAIQHLLNDLLMHIWSRSWDDLRRTNNLMFDLQNAFLSNLGKGVLRVEFGLSRMSDPPEPNRARKGLGGGSLNTTPRTFGRDASL